MKFVTASPDIYSCYKDIAEEEINYLNILFCYVRTKKNIKITECSNKSCFRDVAMLSPISPPRYVGNG